MVTSQITKVNQKSDMFLTPSLYFQISLIFYYKKFTKHLKMFEKTFKTLQMTYKATIY